MSASEAPAAADSRPPEVLWRLVPPDQFPLPALLALLFEPASRVEEKGGDRGAA
jgi:hypothetical protein